MPAPSDDPVAEAERKVATLETELEDVRKQLANLKKHVGKATLGPDASWTVEKLTLDFPFEDFGVAWKKDEDTGRDPLGKLQARYEGLEKKEEILGGLLVTAQNRAKDLRDKKEKTLDTSQWEFQPIPSDSREYYGADSAANDVGGYCSCLVAGKEKHGDKIIWYTNHEGTRVAYVFSYTNSVGKGKTCTFKKLCNGQIVVAVDGYEMRFVMISYNGDKERPKTPKRGYDVATFAQNLLSLHGLDGEEAKKVEDVEHAVKLIADQLEWKDPSKKRMLGVCVDELRDIGGYGTMEVEVASLIKSLAKLQEWSEEEQMKAMGCRVVFLFNSISESVIDNLANPSGRKACHYTVPTIPVDEAKRMLGVWFPEVMQHYRVDYRVTVVVDTCVHNPRALFEGVPKALKHLTGEVPNMSIAFGEIAEKAKLDRNYDLLSGELLSEFLRSGKVPVERVKSCYESGFLVKSDAVHPLVLREACRKDGGTTSRVHTYLRHTYGEDEQLTRESPKRMEKVLYWFEAAKREAWRNTGFTLDKYYKGGIAGPVPEVKMLAFPVWAKADSEKAVVHVDDGELRPEKSESEVLKMARLARHENVLTNLKNGSIVVSQRDDAQGLEYLVPFFGMEDGKLFVAAVQCKFSSEAAQKQRLQKSVAKAENCSLYKYLEERVGAVFTVVFTVGSSRITSTTGSTFRAVVYNHEGLEEFMAPLGPMQLLRVKTAKQPAKGAGGMGTASARTYSTCAWTPCTPSSMRCPPLLQHPRPLSGLRPNAHPHTRQWRGIHTLAARRALPFAGRPVARGAVGGLLSLLARN